MKNIVIIVSCLLGLLVSCRKKTANNEPPPPENSDLKDGLPYDAGTINAYFYATMWTDSTTTNGLKTYVIANDPAKNLMSTYIHARDLLLLPPGVWGNVSIGNVYFNDMQLVSLNSGGRLYYYINARPFYPGNVFSARWKADGNGSFQAFDLTIQRGFPAINTGSMSAMNFSLSKSAGLVFNTAGIVSNFDSLTVKILYLSQEFPSTNALVTKSVLRDAEKILFDVKDVAQLPDHGHALFYVDACNYSTATINGKVYVFELYNKYQSKIELRP